MKLYSVYYKDDSDGESSPKARRDSPKAYLVTFLLPSIKTLYPSVKIKTYFTRLLKSHITLISFQRKEDYT